MKVEKGQVLKIVHRRKGVFVAVVLRDFDSETEEWWPIALGERDVEGEVRDWRRGVQIPCRGKFAGILAVLPSSATSEKEGD